MLMATTVAIINPRGLINRANDARRKSDLHKIDIILESYYNDHNCYAQSIPFGQSMSTVSPGHDDIIPQDPNYPTNFYIQAQNDSPCPKWYAVFSKLTAHNSSIPACKLPSACLPANYQPNWDCLVNGNYSCSAIASTYLPSDISSSTGLLTTIQSLLIGPTQPGPNSSTVTPTPTSIATPTGIDTTLAYPPLTASSSFSTATDGSWCYDSDGKFPLTHFPGWLPGEINIDFSTIGFCQDNSGIYNDFCLGNTARSYYCSRVWHGYTIIHVSCSQGGYVCSDNGYTCSLGACTSPVSSSPAQTSTIPSIKTLTGKDGTWCYDSDGNGEIQIKGTCQDNSGLYSDYCNGELVQDYYCTGNWDGSSYSNVKCAGGTHSCHSHYGTGCYDGACLDPGIPLSSSTEP
jgi:hypothetical protein